MALRVYTLINVLMGSILSFYQYHNDKLRQILHTGPFKLFLKGLIKVIVSYWILLKLN